MTAHALDPAAFLRATADYESITCELLLHLPELGRARAAEIAANVVLRLQRDRAEDGR